MAAKPTRSGTIVPCYVNAAAKAVVLNRMDKTDWGKPLFVNAPSELKEVLWDLLGKVLPTDKPSRTIRFDLDTSLLEDYTIQTGPNAGTDAWIFEIGGESGAITMAEFLSALVDTDRQTATAEDLKAIEAFRTARGIKARTA